MKNIEGDEEYGTLAWSVLHLVLFKEKAFLLPTMPHSNKHLRKDTGKPFQIITFMTSQAC